MKRTNGVMGLVIAAALASLAACGGGGGASGGAKSAVQIVGENEVQGCAPLGEVTAKQHIGVTNLTDELKSNAANAGATHVVNVPETTEDKAMVQRRGKIYKCGAAGADAG